MTAVLLAVGALSIEPGRVLAETRRAAFDRQAWLAAYEQKTSFHHLDEKTGDRRRLTTSFIRADGTRVWMRTLHFGPYCLTEADCESMDGRLNTALQADGRLTVLNENRLHATISAAELPIGDARLRNGGFLERCFLRWPGMEGALDLTEAVTDQAGRPWAYRLRDLWLADALMSAGWTAAPIDVADVAPTWPAAAAVSGEVFALRRTMDTGLRDEVVVAAQFDWLPVARTWRTAEGEVVSTWRFSDFGYEAGHRWYCRSATVERGGRTMSVELERLTLGRPAPESMTIEFPPGCVVEDRIAGTKQNVAGAAFIARSGFARRVRQEFFPSAKPPGTAFPLNVPVFGFWLRLPHPAWALLPGVAAGLWAGWRRQRSAAAARAG